MEKFLYDTGCLTMTGLSLLRIDSKRRNLSGLFCRYERGKYTSTTEKCGDGRTPTNQKEDEIGNLEELVE